MKTTQGIGLTAVIVIVAVLAVGGVAAYEYNQSTKADVETEEEMNMEETEAEVAGVKSAVRAELANLQASLSANVDVAAALNTVEKIKVLISNARVNASAEAEAELDEISASVDRLEADIEAGSDQALDSLTEVAATVDVQIGDAMDDAMSDDDAMEDDGAMMDDGAMLDSETSVEGEAMMDDDAEAQASATSETDLQVQ